MALSAWNSIKRGKNAKNGQIVGVRPDDEVTTFRDDTGADVSDVRDPYRIG